MTEADLRRLEEEGMREAMAALEAETEPEPTEEDVLDAMSEAEVERLTEAEIRALGEDE
jgi:hypothetical protein